MKKIFIAFILAAALTAPAFTPGPAWAQLASLKTVAVPEPTNLSLYVRDRAAAVQLGKALFWDMQMGSDGVQACATCHFHAGADSRTRNQLNPGQAGGDNRFGNNNLGLPAPAGGFGLNRSVNRTNFPFHKLIDFELIGEPLRSPGNVISDTNDVMGSQGVALKQFVDIRLGNPVDLGADTLIDPVFNVGGVNIRQTTGRNTPSVINAVFNFANFWDGRANNIFNGNNPFGPADLSEHGNLAFVNLNGTLREQLVRIRQSALASQSVGPPLSDVEMSWRGRSWPKIGKKMLSLRPLSQQKVHPTDSVLGPLAAPTTGLNTTYAALIRRAFWPRFYNSTTEHLEFVDPADPGQGLETVAGPAAALNTNQFTQMQANFSLFFGLAVQLYESTLLANDSKFDRFMEGAAALTLQEQRGMGTFTGAGGCLACHAGAEMTDASVFLVQGLDPITAVPQPLNRTPLDANEIMAILTGFALYDVPFHNTAVRPGGATDPDAFEFLPTNEDIGRGANSPFTAIDPLNPGNTFPIPLSFGFLGLWKADPDAFGNGVPVPASLSAFIPPLPLGFRPVDTTPFAGRVSNFGAFKTPGLRNIELTGPYMHNGGFSTLHQVVEFYARGGDFPNTNDRDFDPAVAPIGKLLGSEERKNEMVAFMVTLTDQRVREESGPFDHPELFLPITGAAPVSPTGTRDGFLGNTNFRRIPAVGSGGRLAEGLPLLTPFLGLSPISPQ